MLTISSLQLGVFEQAQAQGFEARMAAHLREFFPGECEGLGAEGVRELVRHGVRRAASYGIRAERDVCKYVDLMAALGRDFDREVQWAAAILNVHRLKSPDYKVGRLCEEALAALGGPG